MRSAILAIAPVILSVSLSAQGVFSNKTQVILEKVIQDYPNRFRNIKGELIGQALQTARYKSTIQIPGATSSTVTLVTASGNEGYNWNCTVLEATDFAAAKTRFTQIYKELSNSIVTTAEQKTYILNGQYEAPVVDKKYTAVLFSLLPGVGDMKRLRVELTMHEEERGWVVALSVTDQDPREIAQLERSAK
jgi:hypothetical protein